MLIPPIIVSAEERIALAARCRDADDLPKVAGAGQVHTEADGRRIQTMHNGLKVVADGYCGSWMTELIRQCRGHHEPQEERTFHQVIDGLPDDATMIELGGYWSYYTSWFLKDRPRRQALVVEPDPSHLEVGKANASLNGLSPVFRLGFAGRSPIAQTLFKTAKGGEFRIPCYTVPQLVGDMGWKRLDVLHCDIQGAEVEILETCEPLLKAGFINWIFVSTHVHHISGDPLTHERCLEIVKRCGGFIEAEHGVHESFSGDGLIVARFMPAPDGWKPIRLTYNRASQSLFRPLSYDLADCQSSKSSAAANRKSPTFALNTCLKNQGHIVEIAKDCALGSVGEMLVMPSDKVISPAVLSFAKWEYTLIEQVSAQLHRGQSYTLLDVGANIGLFSRQLARRCPVFNRIVCVEPDPDNFKMLRFNLAHLGQKVEFFNIALGSADGDAMLYRDAGNFGNYSLAPDAMRNRDYRQVPIAVRETSEWVRQQIHQTDRLVWKSDTQGFDESIVAAVPFEVWSRVDVAVMEIWRIEKPAFDHGALRDRLEIFPHRQLGDRSDVSPDDILDFAAGDDWTHRDLVMWR